MGSAALKVVLVADDMIQGTTGEADHGSHSLQDLLRLEMDTAEPMYLQLERKIEALIDRDILKTGATLPAERRLAALLGVSRITVQRSYNGLRQRRLLSAHGRRGFIVQGRGLRLNTPMNRLRGFTEEMRDLGRVASSRIIEKRVVEDGGIAAIFGLPSTAALLRLVRVRLGDDVPMSREVAWYNLALAPGLPDADLSGSVYGWLERNGLPLVYCEQTVQAIAAAEEHRAVFGFDEAVPCMLVKRRSFTSGDRMMEYVEGVFRGDLYSYRMRLNA